ncbi:MULTISPECIES: YlmC/YmxH family sporulation protein [Bacillus]|nr:MULTISPECIES: YlmC/YmxH family sporulation protein [Bacillus]MCU0095651.1 YlmC/YmxH family sporulation protein [Bacillus sp. OR9]HDR7432765.1 YlmC/YmxH family sporulation protein [Bacillus anthracis]MBJ8056959.1 YlmC/YmxH family sporulation protein [Bacillus cereus]MCU4754726.1 YlmC/YmxH family sporulation protein [Bacillus cereus]MCU5104419.1 YlmC/YmxH family sporulation protein [Bacillus cereus]
MKVIRISELQMKDIINVSDGKRLGNIGDIEIDMNTGKIKSIIISKQARMLGIFGKGVEIVIPWEEIMIIGEDVILVRVNPVNSVTESIQTPTIS